MVYVTNREFPAISLTPKRIHLVIKLFLKGFNANSVGVFGDLYELFSRLWVDDYILKIFFFQNKKFTLFNSKKMVGSNLYFK